MVFRMAARTALHQGYLGAPLHPGTAGPSRIGGDQDRVGVPAHVTGVIEAMTRR